MGMQEWGFKVHLIGCAYVVKRSINALFVNPEGIKSILSNVFLFVYAHERQHKSKCFPTSRWYVQRKAGRMTASSRLMREHYSNLV